VVKIRRGPKLWFYFSVVLLMSACWRQDSRSREIEVSPSYSSAVEKASTISFCDLVRAPAQYDKRIIRVKAIFFRDMENAYLNDPTCGIEGSYIWVEFEAAYAYTDDAVKKKLDQTLCSVQPCPTGRAKVIAVGRFEGPGSGPYGHLGDYHFKFSILRIENVEKADPPLVF
jgi:hypothetical protein